MATLNFKNPNTGKWEEIGGGINNDVDSTLVVGANSIPIDNMQIAQYDGFPKEQWVVFTARDSSNKIVYFHTAINTGIPNTSPI